MLFNRKENIQILNSMKITKTKKPSPLIDLKDEISKIESIIGKIKKCHRHWMSQEYSGQYYQIKVDNQYVDQIFDSVRKELDQNERELNTKFKITVEKIKLEDENWSMIVSRKINILKRKNLESSKNKESKSSSKKHHVSNVQCDTDLQNILIDSLQEIQKSNKDCLDNPKEHLQEKIIEYEKSTSNKNIVVENLSSAQKPITIEMIATESVKVKLPEFETLKHGQNEITKKLNE